MGELYRKLEEYSRSDYYPFHMPGHKRRRESAAGSLGKIYGLDITEIDGFDNLHQAGGILAQSQERAAGIYGADRTWFLVNGSTCGILSAVMAAAGRGDRLLMARNSHRSVYHGAYLRELETSYLYPPVLEEWGIAGSIEPREVERALKEQPEIAAVLVTSPTYEGILSDVAEIAHITHSYGRPLIVDEAHGAHFGLHPDYPPSSVSLGADVVIHSLHKTLPSMTQTALLHLKGNLIPAERLERYLRIFQTSSPSYVLMASIDACMDMVEREGERRLESLLQIRRSLAERLKGSRHLRLLDGQTGRPGGGTVFRMDPCKLVIAGQGCGMTGVRIYDALRKRYHLQPEMAAEGYALAILTMMDTKEGVDRLAEALLEMDREIREDAGMAAGRRKSGELQKSLKKAPGKPEESVMTIARAYTEEQAQVPVGECGGRIAAEFINLYPPGIPLAVPGERLSNDLINSLVHNRDMGLNVQGIEKNGCIRVVKE